MKIARRASSVPHFGHAVWFPFPPLPFLAPPSFTNGLASFVPILITLFVLLPRPLSPFVTHLHLPLAWQRAVRQERVTAGAVLKSIVYCRRSGASTASGEEVLIPSGGARDVKVQQTQQNRHVPMKILECNPILAKAEHWLRSHTSPIPLCTRLGIAALCLRWTHATINSKMMFGHGGAELVDQLQRGDRKPSDSNDPLDVAQHEGMLHRFDDVPGPTPGLGCKGLVYNLYQ